jgi:hypothetical protein
MTRSGYLAAVAGARGARPGPALRPPRRVFGAGRVPADEHPATSSEPARPRRPGTPPPRPSGASPVAAPHLPHVPNAPSERGAGGVPPGMATIGRGGEPVHADSPSASRAVARADPATGSSLRPGRPAGDGSPTTGGPAHRPPATFPVAEAPRSIEARSRLQPAARSEDRTRPDASLSPTPPRSSREPDPRSAPADRTAAPGAPMGAPPPVSTFPQTPADAVDPDPTLAKQKTSRAVPDAGREVLAPVHGRTDARIALTAAPAEPAIRRPEPAVREPRARGSHDDAPRVHIGTIDVTVLPPPPPPSPAVAPAPASPARAATTPTSLSRGVGPWYGLSQR